VVFLITDGIKEAMSPAGDFCDIRCHGNFMMLNNSPKANIIFHDVQVDNELLEDKLNRIEMIDDEIVITPVLKKEINWVS